jgi:Uma2 family endonuclease
MGSRNHAYVQAKLARVLGNLEKYAVLTELTLDIRPIFEKNPELLATLEEQGREIKEPAPDVCLYPKVFENNLNWADDVVKIREMPLAVIEILSPRQGIQTIVDKFKVYFAAGIQSCWLVVPAMRSLSVFTALDCSQTFSSGEIVDQVLNLRLPVNAVFGK